MSAFETGRGSRKMEYLKLITEKNCPTDNP